MAIEETVYEVTGWGAGTVWTEGRLVLAHEFDYLGGAAAISGSSREQRPAKPAATDVAARLAAFFEGEHRLDDVLLDLSWCTPFQRDALGALRRIPPGEVVTYGELAALAGRPGAQRAVGTLCARNRFALLVPCHRVVAADGIGGYGSVGVAVKRRLLALEGVRL